MCASSGKFYHEGLEGCGVGVGGSMDRGRGVEFLRVECCKIRVLSILLTSQKKNKVQWKTSPTFRPMFLPIT